MRFLPAEEQQLQQSQEEQRLKNKKKNWLARRKFYIVIYAIAFFDSTRNPTRFSRHAIPGVLIFLLLFQATLIYNDSWKYTHKLFNDGRAKIRNENSKGALERRTTVAVWTGNTNSSRSRFHNSSKCLPLCSSRASLLLKHTENRNSLRS